MKVRNHQARVIAVYPITKEGALAETLFLVPGFNDVSDENEALVKNSIKEYVDEGMISIIGEDDDPFKGSVEKVVQAVKETYDRDLLEEVRKTSRSRKVKDAVDGQLKKITEHRNADG